MKVEIPEFARCCFCFPLRYGLLVWAYLKLVFIAIILCSYVNLIVEAIVFNRFSNTNLVIYVIIFLITIFSCVDLVFHIIFIISAHKKNSTKMKLFYKEILFGLIFYIFCFIYILSIFLSNYSIIKLYSTMELWCFFMLLIFTQGYLIILVRSEVRKLERSSDYQFTNPTTTAEEKTMDTNIIA